MIKFSTLENCTIEEITIVFNAAFSDYLMPMKMSLEQMRHKFETENIALHYSVGAFDNDILVGFILHFSNTENGITKIYNGGTGVIKNYRGNNLTRKMYDYVLPLINKNVSCINLEVLEQNIPAINAYKGIGFELKRKLTCFQGIPKISRTNEDIEIISVSNINWDQIENFWSIQPTWQNAIFTIENMKSKIIFFEAYLKNKSVGYIIFNKDSGKIMQIAVEEQHRNIGIGSQLVKSIIEYSNSKISIINVDSSHLQTINFFKSLGLINYVSQFKFQKKL